MGRKPVDGVMSLGLSDDRELPHFVVGEQKLVDSDGIVRGLVLVFNELRLVVTECQQRPGNSFRLQIILLSIDDYAQILLATGDAR